MRKFKFKFEKKIKKKYIKNIVFKKKEIIQIFSSRIIQDNVEPKKIDIQDKKKIDLSISLLEKEWRDFFSMKQKFSIRNVYIHVRRTDKEKKNWGWKKKFQKYEFSIIKSFE